MRAQVRFVGPDRYCPECRRLLVRVHEDGTLTVAGESAVEGVGTELFGSDEPEWVIPDATCLRRACRLRRRIRRARYAIGLG